MKHTVFSLSISLFLFFSSAGFSQSAKSYAFINASLFNGKENKIYSGSVIFTKGGKIERVGKSGEPTGGYEVIDCEGYFLMPGLIDAHLQKLWCFTDGNAAKRITKFYNDLANLDQIDWPSIQSEDFRHINADGDEDRVRKKHAEFLVKDKVPHSKITGIAVVNANVKAKVEAIVSQCNLEIEVKVKPKFYF
ncbi:MAG: DarT ssDNA thymidine ADP-ribosyltransferase family protein [Cyclobacteriaceae bacterium]|jgi:imidazolonepropionase-like amidohydrolase